MTLLIIAIIVAGIVAAVVLNSKKKPSFPPKDVVSDYGADRPTVILEGDSPAAPVEAPVEPVVSNEELAALAEAKKKPAVKKAAKKQPAKTSDKKSPKKK